MNAQVKDVAKPVVTGAGTTLASLLKPWRVMRICAPPSIVCPAGSAPPGSGVVPQPELSLQAPAATSANTESQCEILTVFERISPRSQAGSLSVA